MNRNSLFTLVVLSVLPLAACGDTAAEAATALVRDSAGIQIVENTAAAWRDGEGWRLSDAPTLEIGMLDGPEEYQLFRVSGAIRLPDGRIVVANSGTHQLRFYDADGAHLLSAGGEGGGPGEFQAMGAPEIAPGDSLLVPDRRHGRISVFGLDGIFVRAFPLPSVGGRVPARFTDILFDGSLLLTQSSFPANPGEIETGLVRDSVQYLRFDPASEQLDTLGTFPGRESFVQMQQSGGELVSISIIRFPFLRGSYTSAAGDRFYHGASDRYEIGLYSRDGTLERLVRREHQPEPVEGEYIERFGEERRREAEESGSPTGPVDDALAEVPLPPTLPAYSSILVDDEGNLWVEPFRWPGDDEPRWEVFDPEGQLLGTVVLPTGFQPTHIGPDFVLGTATDDFDVEYLRMYGLVKS